MNARTLSLLFVGMPLLFGGGGGCASRKPSSELPEVNTGLSALAANEGADLGLSASFPPLKPGDPLPESTGVALAQRAALDVQAALDRDRARRAVVSNASGIGETAPGSRELGSEFDGPSALSLRAAASDQPPDPAATGLAVRPSVPAFAGSGESTPTGGGTTADLAASASSAWEAAARPAQPTLAATRSPDDELVELAEKMAALLRRSGSGTPLPDSAALAPIEAMRPGAMESLERSESVLSTRLSAADRKALLEARDRIANGRSAAAATDVATAATLRVARAVLCTKVAGFGAYTPYPTTSFAAGAAVPAIVYVEIENFAARPARESDPLAAGAALADQVSVELSQSLTLYQDPGGLQVWHKSPQKIVETGRTKRRDFYLIQRIDLPRTLSIGRYDLKVTVKDRTTSAEAEASIPITIVAR